MENGLDHVSLTQEQILHAKNSARYEKVQMHLAWARTIACVAVALIVAFAAIQFGPVLENTLTKVNEAANALSDVAIELNEADITGMLAEVETLVADAEVAVVAATETMEGSLAVIEGVELDTLNAAIEDFASVVEPLARLFGR